MVQNTGSRLPNSTISLTEAKLAHAIGAALQSELGASGRAVKTVMRWADVSDRTARTWLQGHGAPDAIHLIALSSHCPSVMTFVLKAAGYQRLSLSIDLIAAETALAAALATVRQLAIEPLEG